MTYQQIVQLENDLRSYIAEQVKRLDDIIPEYANVRVSYDHNDGNGMWNVWCHSGDQFDVKAVMISVAVDEAIDRISRAARLKELPRLLVAPSANAGASVVSAAKAAKLIEDESDE